MRHKAVNSPLPVFEELRITQIVAQVRISVLNTFTGLVLFLPLTDLPDDIFPTRGVSL